MKSVVKSSSPKANMDRTEGGRDRATTAERARRDATAPIAQPTPSINNNVPPPKSLISASGVAGRWLVGIFCNFVAKYGAHIGKGKELPPLPFCYSFVLLPPSPSLALPRLRCLLRREPAGASGTGRAAMEVFYYLLFGALSLVVAGLEFSKTSKDRVTTSSAFNSFKNNYLVVYSLMMAGDWLQGPYVYFLYSQYGFDKGDIGRLFIAGFGSSMLFGTIVGSLADKQGRKWACITYCITYILSCITKHSPQYKVLMLGRVLGGIATSLLFSAFESWLVAEHNKRGFDPQWLSLTFSKAIFLGNGLIAIVSGLFANVLADNLGFGPVAPFDAAACFLAVGMAIIMSSWTENYGDPSESKNLLTQFKGAAVAIASDEKIALLGAIQSLFEGSMYTFVFLWTPALSPNEENIPHGFIFATFMLSSMLGSSIASRLMTRASLKVESYMQIIFVISAFTLLLPIITSFLVAPSSEKGGSISFAGCIQLFGFCIFEACVGIFWPSIMKMRSQYIPEEARSTIMNFFRIPLNIFVCIVLYNVNAFPITVMFGMCSIFLCMASVLQRRLMVVAEIHKSKPQDWTALKERDSEAEPLNASQGTRGGGDRPSSSPTRVFYVLQVALTLQSSNVGNTYVGEENPTSDGNASK
ncbi:hypothetical protein Taro_002702 [Colocasia esculenta]|uniref:Molybdate-anion transporter n=1 Tax=Colocasia esculenta TaxID=4460 RepID=A0A843THT7_COLES|nr:hypothetical protein [Colocasia esculenta]